MYRCFIDLISLFSTMSVVDSLVGIGVSTFRQLSPPPVLCAAPSCCSTSHLLTSCSAPVDTCLQSHFRNQKHLYVLVSVPCSQFAPVGGNRQQVLCVTPEVTHSNPPPIKMPLFGSSYKVLSKQSHTQLTDVSNRRRCCIRTKGNCVKRFCFFCGNNKNSNSREVLRLEFQEMHLSDGGRN